MKFVATIEYQLNAQQVGSGPGSAQTKVSPSFRRPIFLSGNLRYTLGSGRRSYRAQKACGRKREGARLLIGPLDRFSPTCQFIASVL